MAARKDGNVQLSATAAKLREELTCPTCLDLYTDPRALPCQHAYCKDCLRLLNDASPNRQSIDCPECRSVWPIPGGSAENLPRAFRINRLQEIHLEIQTPPQNIPDREEKDEKKEEEMGDAPDGPAPSPLACPKHPYHELDLFCGTCSALICRDCIVVSRSHTEHDYSFVRDVAAEHKRDLLATLDLLEQRKEGIATAIDRVGVAREHLDATVAEQERLLKRHFEGLEAVLAQEKDSLLQRLLAVGEEKRARLDEQGTALEAAQTSLQAALSSAHTASRELVGVEFMLQKEALVAEVGGAEEMTTRLNLDPIVKVDVMLQLPRVSAMTDLLQEGCVIQPVDPNKCRTSGHGLESGMVGRKTSFEVELSELRERPEMGPQSVSAELVSRDGAVTTVEVSGGLDGRFTASYTPQTRGSHQVHVKLNGAAIPESPFDVAIRMPLKSLSSPVSVINVSKPSGIALTNEGSVLVADSQHYSVLEISSSTWSVTPLFTVPGEPRCLAVDSHDNIFVTDSVGQTLYKFDSNGKQLLSLRKSWRGQAEFNQPLGVAISQVGTEVLVCDGIGGHRVLTYSTELKPLRCIGAKGGRDGRFNLPTGIAVDDEGNVYVADSLNQRVQVFGAGGSTHLRNIRMSTRWQPHGVFVRGKLLLLTDSINHCVHVFMTEGTHVASFGDDYLSRPEGIVVDDDGFVYVSDRGGDSVIVF